MSGVRGNDVGWMDGQTEGWMGGPMDGWMRPLQPLLPQWGLAMCMAEESLSIVAARLCSACRPWHQRRFDLGEFAEHFRCDGLDNGISTKDNASWERARAHLDMVDDLIWQLSQDRAALALTCLSVRAAAAMAEKRWHAEIRSRAMKPPDVSDLPLFDLLCAAIGAKLKHRREEH